MIIVRKGALQNIQIRRMMRYFLKVASLEQLELLSKVLDRCIEKRKNLQLQLNEKNDHIA